MHPNSSTIGVVTSATDALILHSDSRAGDAHDRLYSLAFHQALIYDSAYISTIASAACTAALVPRIVQEDNPEWHNVCRSVIMMMASSATITHHHGRVPLTQHHPIGAMVGEERRGR